MPPTVPEFYSGKSIFITGGTGFVGKVLIYKLLKSCPDLKVIYLLLRQKKGVSSEERLVEFSRHMVFDTIREINPDFSKKLRLISGDITEDGLGISDEDRMELLNECNIVIHSAACVRFDQKLKDAVNVNTKGTLRILTLAESMKNLEMFLHISTAYCCSELEVLEEKLYKAIHNPRKIIDFVDWIDDKTLDYIEPKITASEPNTYSYTKTITEDLVAEYASKFPVAIARLPLVIAAWKEPVPGWIDSMQGPAGIIVGTGKGVIRSMICKPSVTIDAMAVDVVVNGCLLIAYVTALDKPLETQIYNLTLSGMHSWSLESLIKMAQKLQDEYPFTVALWYPGGSVKTCWITHQISVIIFHIIPAYLIDALLFLLGRETFMVRVQKRISLGLSLLEHYCKKQWHFTNKRFRSLHERINKKDDEEFFTDVSSVNMDEFFTNTALGIRKFVVKEDLSTLPRAKRLNRIRYFVDRIVKIIFCVFLAWFLYSKYHFFTQSVEYLYRSLMWLPC